MKLGILGGGQLARMMALAGYPLGFAFRFFDANGTEAVQGLGECIHAPWEDAAALAAFAQGLDAVTIDTENVPTRVLRLMARAAYAFPNAVALRTAQDRAREKACFRALGIPTADYRLVETLADLEQAVAAVGLPAVLKTRRFGYDGKGQFVLRSPADLVPAWEVIGGVPLILERFVEFDREVSLVAVRGRAGQMAYYPLVENRHQGGILASTLAPAPRVSRRLQQRAEQYLHRVMDALRYVGVLTVEFFQCGGQLVANEMAPRVHNSGHWTIEGAETSQFENHLRAGLGLPLGDTRPRGRCLMLNLLGSVPPREAVLTVAGVHMHVYGKRPQPGRKLGHLTICGGRAWPETPAELVALGLPRVAAPNAAARKAGA